MILSRQMRSVALAGAVLVISAGVVAASSLTVATAGSTISAKLQWVGTKVSQPAALNALVNANARAQAGLAVAAGAVSGHDDAISLAANAAARGVTAITNSAAASPLDALTAAGAAAHAGLAKAGDAITNNPTSNDDVAWDGLNTAAAAIDAGLAKAAEAVGKHH